MADFQILFKKGNFIQNIEIDAFIVETASASATVTTNPVEKGADISDHIIINPITITVQGIVSNASSSLIRTITSFNTVTDKTRNQTTWDSLLELHASRKLFTLAQNLKAYDDVALTALNTVQDKNTSNALVFNATFTQINIVGTGTIEAATFTEEDIEDQASTQIQGGLKQLGEP
jgi:hypothetical protein